MPVYAILASWVRLQRLASAEILLKHSDIPRTDDEVELKSSRSSGVG